MRNLWKIPVLFLAALLVVYLLAFFWAVPKLAAFSVPARWQRLPVKQRRMLVRDYLGQPLRADGLRDLWEEGIAAKKTYQLSCYYSTDTTCIAYAIRYQYRSVFFSKAYLLDSLSVR